MKNWNEIKDMDLKVQAKFTINTPVSFALVGVDEQERISYEQKERKPADSYGDPVPYEVFGFNIYGFILPSDPNEQTMSARMTVNVRGVVKNNDDALDVWASVIKMAQKSGLDVLIKGQRYPVLRLCPSFVPISLGAENDAVVYLSGVCPE